MSEQRAEILFDGVCNLCNGFVQFVIKHDPNSYFSFAALQSNYAQQKLELRDIDKNLSSVVLIESGVVYSKSTAALRILKKLNGLYPLLYGFIIVPTFIRDFIYSWVARKRYVWFGKSEQCMVPTPQLKMRFKD